MSFWSPADTLATRKPGVVYPGGAGSMPQVVATSDVLRDRAAGITRDPTTTPGSWVDIMNRIMGTAVSMTPTLGAGSKVRGHRRGGTPAPAQAAGGGPGTIAPKVSGAWAPVVFLGIIVGVLVFLPRLVRR
jgi:hypothetical protein